MKKIIDGKLYNTETAKFLAEFESSDGKSSFAWYREALYITRSGNYFLYGEGHASSKYAESAHGSNGWVPGKDIVPISPDYAKKWGEISLEADDYESVFGKVTENKVKISADISIGAKEKIDSLKDGKIKSNGDVIEYLLTLIN